MKRFLLPLSLLCITLISSSARMNADTISITQAVISINLNFGAGDNVSSSMTGPGTQISGGGGAGCDFCFTNAFLFPGTSVSASVDFIAPLQSLLAVQINGTTYDPNNLSFGSSFISSGTITFPAGNVPVFTVTLPATVADIHGGVISAGQSLTLIIHPGELVLSFHLKPANDVFPANYEYAGGEFITTPEPGTLGLMASGLAAIAGAIVGNRNKQFFCSRRWSAFRSGLASDPV